MKIFKIYTEIICSLLLFMTASCDQENRGAEYVLSGEGVSFLTASSSISALPSETSANVAVSRGNTKGRLEVPITAAYNENVFSLPSSIVFEDGAGTANLSIPLEKTVLGTTYSITVAFDSALTAINGKFKTTFNIMRDYVWVDAGIAEMTSSWAGVTADVKIEAAKDSNPKRYRLMSPYNALEPAYCPKSGFHLVFELDNNFNALNFLPGQLIGETDATYGSVYFFRSGDTFTNDGNEFTVNGTFYVSAGSYGRMPEIFVWKKGYPGE